MARGGAVPTGLDPIVRRYPGLTPGAKTTAALRAAFIAEKGRLKLSPRILLRSKTSNPIVA